MHFSNDSENSKVQNVSNYTRMQDSEQKNILSYNTNSENQLSPSNLEDPTSTTPEQDDTTLENPGDSPSTMFASNETYEQDGINLPIGDFSEQQNTLSYHTNSDNQEEPSNLNDPSTTTPESTHEMYERDGIDLPTGDFSGTD